MFILIVRDIINISLRSWANAQAAGLSRRVRIPIKSHAKAYNHGLAVISG